MLSTFQQHKQLRLFFGKSVAVHLIQNSASPQVVRLVYQLRLLRADFEHPRLAPHAVKHANISILRVMVLVGDVRLDSPEYLLYRL